MEQRSKLTSPNTGVSTVQSVMSSVENKFDCIVLNGTVVTAADIGRYDIGIKDGKIHMLAPALSLANVPASRVIDAEGAYVTV